MSYTNIMIHSVWRTKRSERILFNSTRKAILEHIKDNAVRNKIFIDTINAEPEHVHCLFRLNADLTVAKTINLIKGESSHWMNQYKIIPTKFEWADKYFAVSVSPSLLPVVRKYIMNQEAHHKKMTFQEEYNEFLRITGQMIPG